MEAVKRSGQELDNICTENRRPHIKLTAGQGITAESNREDRIHLDIFCDNVVVDRADAADLDEGGHCNTKTEDNECEEFNKDRIDTIKSCRLLINTDSLCIESEVGKLQRQRDQDNTYDHYEYCRRDRDPRDNSAEAFEFLTRYDRKTVGIDPCGDRTACRKHDECRNHRLDLKDRNQCTVKCTTQHTDETCDEECDDDRGLQGFRRRVRSAEDTQHR